MTTKSKKKAKIIEKTRKIEFSFSASLSQSVFIASNFNQWNLHFHSLKMDNKRGLEGFSRSKSPGKYEYCFFVDGEWQNDLNYNSFVENSFGATNSLKIFE